MTDYYWIYIKKYQGRSIILGPYDTQEKAKKKGKEVAGSKRLSYKIVPLLTRIPKTAHQSIKEMVLKGKL